MNRIPVSSSRISSVGWENNTLEVQFKDGAIYQYRAFMNAPSLGHELSNLDKVHRYKRID